MKGTRLWQAPGSPIIQGRSRTERPFWEAWLGAYVAAELLVFAVGVLLALRQPGLTVGAAMGSFGVNALLPSIPGCALGAALGVALSRTMGWRRQWLAGALLGAALAGLTIALI